LLQFYWPGREAPWWSLPYICVLLGSPLAPAHSSRDLPTSFIKIPPSDYPLTVEGPHAVYICVQLRKSFKSPPLSLAAFLKRSFCFVECFAVDFKALDRVGDLAQDAVYKYFDITKYAGLDQWRPRPAPKDPQDKHGENINLFDHPTSGLKLQNPRRVMLFLSPSSTLYLAMESHLTRDYSICNTIQIISTRCPERQRNEKQDIIQAEITNYPEVCNCILYW